MNQLYMPLTLQRTKQEWPKKFVTKKLKLLQQISEQLKFALHWKRISNQFITMKKGTMVLTIVIEN